MRGDGAMVLALVLICSASADVRAEQANAEKKAVKAWDDYGYEFADDPLAAGGFGP